MHDVGHHDVNVYHCLYREQYGGRLKLTWEFPVDILFFVWQVKYSGKGPVAGFIEERIGCSIIAIVGSALIGIGLGASCFADSLYLLYLTYGVVTGIGFSLCHVAANVSVNVYFKTRRVMAAGLSSAGCAVGTIVFPIIGTRLIEEYMWQGTFLIMAGIGLPGIYCGLMLKRSKDSSGKLRYSTTEENHEITEDKPEITYDTQDVNIREELERSNRSKIWIKTKEIYRTPTFVLLIISGTCVSLAFFVPFVMLPDMLIERGMRKNNAALMITTTGIASFLYDVTNSFDLSFVSSGVLFLAGGILSICAATLTCFEKKPKKEDYMLTCT
ncbi:hypothetical protein FSP39_002874 [Pinctada imbricata]|uniref:Uncharacterized protein n=1 Tax=Pinctada imbricata TaxID=66713 RepID=A0AA88YI92_PINIB|nr:hypothetical protein FSP39_002874 [Pinctada imbricata]